MISILCKKKRRESRLFNVHIQYSGIFAAIQLHYGKKIRRKIKYAERLLQIHGYV